MEKIQNNLYVIGHVNPDTDSIAAAMGYAWLLQDQMDETVIPARAGQLNPQTTWVLNHLKLEPPMLLSDASPRFGAIVQRFDATTPDRPLRDVWAIANKTGGIAPVLNPDGTPYGLVTVLSLFRFLQESVGVHPRREEMQLSEIMERPCSEACDTGAAKFQKNTRIRDVISKILHDERTEFWVVDENGRYEGICRQRDALNPPRYRLVLVDHNEPRQSLGSIDEADLYEILDHHRLANSTTRTPIRFTVDVVGSTCTLVSERISEAGLSAPPALAGLLLAGLISDTLMLTSPTTTPRDHKAAERLGRWSFMRGAPLDGESFKTFGEKVISAGAGLASRAPKEIITADFKLYDVAGINFGVSQVEVVNRSQIQEYLPDLKQAMIELRDSKGLNFMVLMITDVVRSDSYLLLSDEIPALEDLPYPRRPDGTRSAEGVVSRKKQLLPMLLGALEG
ncbi:MAG: hypothetical protein DWQ04_28570 [Chloroflexi bacterium]|nr:MAG: hypothetical protein DWQ04_28570 [Chloroflexota bacterium]